MNLQEQTNRIKQMMNLNESNTNKYWLLRRLRSPEITKYLEEEMYNLVDLMSPCAYTTAEEYVNEVLEVLLMNFKTNFSQEYYDEKYMMELDDILWDTIKKKYSSYIINQFEGRICDENNYEEEDDY